jgi:hypothetical protein
MPRKSAAATATIEPRGHRLEPPPGLSGAERAAFVAAVKSVKPGHFAAEDEPLLVAYAAAIVQERAIARDLEAAEAEDEEEEKAKTKDRLRTAHGRVAGSLTRLARALRLGAMARAPSRHRRLPGTVEPSGPPPWEYRHAEGKAH